MKTICAFIQVRMNSNRLTGKALSMIDGKTAIERVVESVALSKLVSQTVITTTEDASDDTLAAFCRERGLPVFRGSVLNVVERFYNAARAYRADIVVRVTGDCPAISAELMDFLIEAHIRAQADYTAINTDMVPIGVYSEIISFSALERLCRSGANFDYSEYMTYYFRNNPTFFKIQVIDPPRHLQFPKYRLTLDYAQDLEVFNLLYRALRERKMAFSLSNIDKVLREQPAIAKINEHLGLKYKTNQDLIRNISEATSIKKTL